MEMPLCQLAVALELPFIGLELDNYQATDVYKIFKEDWQDFDIIEDWRWFATDEFKGTMGDLLRAYRPLDETLWVAGVCQRSKWKAGHISQGERGFVFRLEVPETRGRGPIGDGDLMATSIIVSRTFVESLLQHGSGLRQVVHEAVAHAAKRITEKKGRGKMGEAAKWSADLAMGGVTWERVVDVALQAVTKYSEYHAGDRLYAVQSRDGWEMELCKSVVLLLAACIPLMKPIVNARSLHQRGHQLALAVHTVLDLCMLLTVLCLCSAAPGARAFSGKLSEATDILIKGLAQGLKAGDSVKIVDFFVDECTTSHANANHCDSGAAFWKDLATNPRILQQLNDTSLVYDTGITVFLEFRV